jgi:hypothetical protein
MFKSTKRTVWFAFTVFTLQLNKLAFNNIFISCQCGVIGTFRAYMPIFRLYLSATYIYVISKRNKCSTYQKGFDTGGDPQCETSRANLTLIPVDPNSYFA